MDATKPFLGLKFCSKLDQNKKLISLVDLSELSGYSIELLRNELALDGDEISMDELREKMMILLDSTMENVS